MKKLISLILICTMTMALCFGASIKNSIQAVYSENPNWDEYWSIGLPEGKSTKWKVTEIWYYSDQELEYTQRFTSTQEELQNKLNKIIPGCVLRISTMEKSSHEGWLPEGCEYAMCVRLESKNCYEENVWCETIKTSKLSKAYDTIKESIPKFILNY